MSRIVWVAQIWCIIILLHSLSIHLLCKTPGASKIIFCSGSADCGIFIITVNIEFHFTFAPPVTFQCGKCNISSYIMTFSFYSVKDCIIFLLLCQSLSPPLCMEISDIIRKLIIQTVIYLIEECRNFICMLIFQSDFCFFLKRHREVTVKSSAWHHCHWDRIYNTLSSKTTAEEISERTFHRWRFLIIPVHTDDQISQYKAICIGCLIIHSDPDMIDLTRTFHLCKSYSCTWLNILQAGTSFSGRSQMARCHSAFTFFSVWILCIDCTASSMFCQSNSTKSTFK